MRITETSLRKIIREVINELYDSNGNTLRVTVGQRLRNIVSGILNDNGIEILSGGFSDGSTSWSFVIHTDKTPTEIKTLVWDVVGNAACDVTQE